jgi:DNA invertase Pin-like site-specific DNA recombinase
MGAGRFFFHVMTNFVEMERNLIIERTQTGFERREKGRNIAKNADFLDNRCLRESHKNAAASDEFYVPCFFFCEFL